MINKLEVGKCIAACRVELGYSQSAFAEKLDVSTQAVSKWETGLAIPSVELLLKISWLSKMSINNILEGDDAAEQLKGIGRGLQRLNRLLCCPQCRSGLKLNTGKGPDKLFYECDHGHIFDVDEGVVFFGTREIPGELWSLWLRNYEHYLEEQRHPGLPRYMEGEISYKEVMWREVEKRRPRVILDIATGTGSGIKYIIERINWPCTLIMTDLSHRILKWNKIYFSTEYKNPYVDIVYLACDCAGLPVFDGTIDLVTSFCGFESMQKKMLNGLNEANRVLKKGSEAVYSMSLVDDHKSANTKKWIKLYMSLGTDPNSAIDIAKMNDLSQWKEKCKTAGYQSSEATKIYFEMPAPEGDEFPFENMILRWMANYVVTSRK